MKKTEKVGYPTQKPIKLLQRIIEASTNEGDFILDPFCGCATACVAAESLGRKWVGIDISRMAYDLVQDRIKKEVVSDLFEWKEIYFKVDAPIRNKDIEKVKKKHLYIIQSPSYPGWYKVGIATDINKRKGSYQTGSPFRDYEMIYNVETEKYKYIEKAVHDHFDNRHEWVNADLEDVKDFIKSKL